MLRWLVVTFVAVVIALTSVGVALAVAVHGPLRTLGAIADDHGRAVRLTTTIRSSMSEGRRMVLAEVSAPGAGTAPFGASRLYRELEKPLSELSVVCNTSFEIGKLVQLRAALTRSAAEAEAIERRITSGNRESARDRVAAFLETTREANDAADAILAFNALEVEQSSHRVQRTISALTLAMLALSVAAAAGAYVLLRFARRGVVAHEATWQARFMDIDAFAARAAHEMRTPLQTVTLALASASPSALDRARRSADRMRRTIDALLEFSRAGAGPSADALSNVREIVAEVQEDLSPLIEKQGAMFEVDVDPGAHVGVAPEHLRAIVRNLVVNALRYAAARPGGHVAIRAHVDERWIHIEVRDDGPGIPPSVLPRVFEPFVRGTDAPGGFGVGLATVRRLVEGHGGTVALESAPGRGTTVRIRLPRRDPGQV
jgi:signal transduction histidine kinase